MSSFVLMTFYLATPWVLLDGARPVEAVRSRLARCLGNLLPLTVVGLALTVVAVISLP